jgi:ethanolamine utilization protein EutA
MSTIVDRFDRIAAALPPAVAPSWAGTALRLHDIEEDHYHGLNDYSVDHEKFRDGLWEADNVELVSVGIDIGSSGTQVVFSRIWLQRLSDNLSSRYVVVDREQLYQSPVSLTPYAECLSIDAHALGHIIDDAYNEAQIDPGDVDTGAVILTGEALRRDNAHSIAHVLAHHGGEFVCTMAGHHIEAQLAAYGSGAAWASNERRERVLNIDIGGGTTKFAVIEGGRVLETAAIHVGGRLHVYDDAGALIRLEPAGKALAADAGLDWSLGTVASETERDALATVMAEAVVAAVSSQAPSETVRRLFLTDPIADLSDIDGVMFSGGVSEYVYANEEQDFGDMGRRLGEKLAAMAAGGALPWPMLPAGSGIRATALGLSEYSVQLSGNTIFASEVDRALPRRNLRVVQPDIDLPETIDPTAVAAAIIGHIEKFELNSGEPLAYALRWQGLPTYRRIRALAEGIALALTTAIAGREPIYFVLDGDIGRTLGQILRDELHVTAPLVIADGVQLSSFDFIDLGKMRSPSNTVPITIKSLLFSKDPRAIDAMPQE